MDPVEQTLAQQTSGSAQGQGFGSFYIQGKQLAQQQQNINLSKRRVAVEEAQNARQQQEFDILKPFLAENAKSKAIIQGAEVVVKSLQARQAVAQSVALPDLLDLQMRFQQSPQKFADPGLLEEARQYFKAHPMARLAGVGSEIWQGIRAGPMIDTEMNQVIDAARKLKPEGLYPTGIQEDPTTGKTHIGVGKLESSIPAILQEVAALTNAQAVEKGITDPKQIHTMYTDNLDAKMNPMGLSITHGADGSIVVTQGRQPPAMMTKAEDAINAAANLAGYGADLIELAKNSDNVGVWGNARRFAEKYGGQFGVNIDSKSAFDYASATSLFKAGATKVLKSDGQIAEAERQSLLRRVSDAQLGESSKSAIAETSYLMRKVAESARRQALRVGRPLPPELMNPQELALQVANGVLTEDQGRALNRRSPFSQDLNEPPPPKK